MTSNIYRLFVLLNVNLGCCCCYFWLLLLLSLTETVESGLIPGRVKPKTKNIGIYSYPTWRLTIKKTV